MTINKPGGKISYNFNKIKFNFGSGFGITHYNFLDKTMQQSYIRDFTNFFPTATFVYTYKSNHALRLTYNGYTSQPTINQLQPLRNNNNPFNEYIGNPDLDPSFTNNFNLFQNTYDFIKDRYTYASVNVSFTNNSFTNNRIIDPVTGKTTTQPINTNGNVSVSMYTGTGFKLKKTGIKIYVGPNGSFTRFADIINSNLSFSNNVSGGLTVNFSKSKDKKYDISINNDLSYNYNKNAQSSYGSHFYTNYLSLKATVYYKKVWSINSEYQFYARQKSTDKNYNFNNHIWNAQIQRTFKNDEFTVFFRARDLLNQNIGFYRSYYSNTYTEEVDTRLKRYFMLGFSWDFKNK